MFNQNKKKMSLFKIGGMERNLNPIRNQIRYVNMREKNISIKAYSRILAVPLYIHGGGGTGSSSCILQVICSLDSECNYNR